MGIIASKINKDLLRILFNTNWLIIERVIRLVAAITVGVWVARYLGPEQFGILNYTISFVAILGSFTSLGLIGFVVNQLVEQPEKKNEILGTTFYLRLISGIVGVIFILLYSLFAVYEKELMFLMCISSCTLIVSAFDVIDLWYQSEVASKSIVICRSISVVITSVLKIIFIVTNQSIVVIALSFLLELLISAFLMILVYQIKHSIRNWRFSKELALEYLSKTWPLIFSSLAAAIYLKIDMVMLKELAGETQTGLYAAAVRLSEVWYFLPPLIVSSAFPYLIKAKKTSEKLYLSKLQLLLDILFLIALIAAVLVTFSSDLLVRLAFGEEYQSAIPILNIHIWAAIFVFIRAVLSRWIITEGILRFSLYSQLSGAIMNVILNLILIPKYGGIGSAYATLISYAFPTYLICFIYPRAHLMAKMMTLTFLSPIRYIIFLIKKVGGKQNANNNKEEAPS